MIDQTAIKNVRALVLADKRLRMDAEMYGVEIINAIADAFLHSSQEAAQGIGLITAFNPGNTVIVDG